MSAGIIKNADFEMEKGTIIGVTGPVASGKSTVGRALQGFLSYEGSIKICGKELNTIESGSLCQYTAYMGHDSSLLSDTIYNNITLGKDGDISEVLSAVCFDEDLNSMPDGMNTRVGSYGVRLSGGQKARLALARTLYNKAPLIILDDPFAAVDVETEKKIMNNLRKYCKDSGIVLISHRIGGFDRAEKVLLTEEGRTTFDTHENLMEKSELYRDIYSMQAKGGSK